MCTLLQINNLIKTFDLPVINFDVFQQTSTECHAMIHLCQPVHRIIECLKYYQTLNFINTNDQQKIVIFGQQIYPLLLDDYIHIITSHDNDLSQILNYMITKKGMPLCDFFNCTLGRRHFRDRQIDQQNSTAHVFDIQFLFYQSILDSIHCHLYHLYDTGLRMNTNHINDIHTTDTNDTCIDTQFQNLCDQLTKNKTKLKHINGLDAIKSTNNKFNLTTNTQNPLCYGSNQDVTFLDGLYQYMIDNNVAKKQMKKIKFKLEQQAYDSDSIVQDIIDIGPRSNAAMMLDNNLHYFLLEKYIRQTKISEGSFNIGYRFYYWSLFKHYRSSKEYVKDSHNDNAHSGHLPHELYISIKYTSMKDEILNNKLYVMKLSEYNLSVLKANEYLSTTKVRAITAGEGEDIWDLLNYNIEQGTHLSLHNLLSIIFYCDWSVLSRAFSSTFRKIKPFESLSSVKSRNREYANWSKYLRETIEYFGKMGWDSAENKRWNIIHNRERGPFYCGISFVIALPQFNIRLCSPTSTTKNIEVATRFGGDRGIIIQLNNGDQDNSLFLRSWDCSWISNFGAENERLFIGGYYTIKLENVRIIETKKNYYDYFTALYYFDCMLTGNTMSASSFDPHKVTNKHYKIICKLINYKLSKNAHDFKYAKYIWDTFEAFVNMKSQINLNLENLDFDFQKLSDLIMYPITTAEYPRKNIFRTVLLKVFKNVQHIIIYTTSKSLDVQEEYTIDLLCLLELLKEEIMFLKNTKITIKAACPCITGDEFEYATSVLEVDNSWIGKLYKDTNWKIISNKYKESNYIISFFPTQSFLNGEIFEEEWLVIQTCVD